MSSNTKLRASPSQDDPSVNSSPFKVTEARQQRVHRGCCGHTQYTIPCLLESLFSGVFVVPLYRENLYLFFILFSGAACILSTHRTLSLLSFTSGTLVARISLMQPLLMLTTFATCMVGIVCTKSQLTRSHRICPLHMSWYSSRLNRRLQRALWCVPVALALYTIACLPIPTDRHYSVSSLLTLSAFCRLRGPSDWETPLFNNSAQLNGTAGTTKYLVTPSVDVFHGLWPLIFATLNIQSLLVGLLPLTIRLLICASIAGLHSAMVLVSHFAATLPPPKPYFLSDDYIVFECSPTYVAAMEHTAVAWWNSAEMYFWRGFAVNLLSFVSANLVGYHLARLKELAQWRCLFVVLSSSARSRHLQLAQSKLSIVSRSLVPAPLAADLEQDFTSGVCSWTSPLVIYLRNVSFMSAELVGFCTSAGDPSDARACTEAELVVDGPGGITGPSPGHVISFLNQLMSQVNSIAETHGCYPVHLRPSEILCVAGYPDVRVDHAHSCVQLALEIRRLVSSIANSARVGLQLRIAVHTGEAYAAVFGKSMLAFDLLGPDVVFLRQLRSATIPGRVLVSRSTFDQLPEGYEGEIGPFFASTSSSPDTADTTVSGPETFYVQPRKLTDSKDSSPSLLGGYQCRWPCLTQVSGSTLATCFARLARSAGAAASSHLPLDFLFSAEEGKWQSKEEMDVLRLCLLHQLLADQRQASARASSASSSTGDTDNSTDCLHGRCSHSLRADRPPSSGTDIPDLMTSRLQKTKQGLSFGAQCSLPSLFSHDSPVSRIHQLLHSCHLDHHQQQHSTPTRLSWPFSGAGDDDAESTLECLGCSLDAPTLSPLGEPLLASSPSCSAASDLLTGCPDLREDIFCPLVDSQFWAEFQSRPRLDAMRQSVFWLLVLLCLVGVILALLLARTSIVLLSLPVLLIWCLLVSILFSVFNSSATSCFTRRMRQTCLAFTLLILLASALLVSTLGRIGVTGWRHSPLEEGEGAPIEFRTPWLQPPCIEVSTLPACLILLFPLLVADSLNSHASGPSPCMVGILSGLFSLLHLASVAWRAAFTAPAAIVGNAGSNVSALHEPTDVDMRPSHLNPVHPLLWVHVFTDFTFAHVVFVLLVCFLPWQTRELNQWTDKWASRILRQKRQLTAFRFALARLLANCAPRHNLVDLLDPYYGNPLGLVSQGYDDTGVMAVTIRAGPTVRGRLERHNSLSSNSHRSREATVVADCVRRLNKLICLIDDLAIGGFPRAYNSGDSLIDDTLRTLEKDAKFMSTFANRDFPTLLKVYCVGPTLVFANGLCPPHSEGNGKSGDHLVQLAYFAQLIRRIFDELRSQAKRSDDFYSVEIGLHVGPTIMGIVGQTRPKLVVLEETLGYALRLISHQQSTAPTTGDGSTLHESLSTDQSVIIASTRFVSDLTKSHLADPLPVSAGCRIDLDGDRGIYVWPAEVSELEQFGSFVRRMKASLVPGGRSQYPLRQRGSIDRQERAASHLVDAKGDATFVTPSTYRRLHHRMSEQLVVGFPQRTSPLSPHPVVSGGGDLASSAPPPPPLPPHKRTYVAADVVALNPSDVSRKFSAPTSRPEAASHRDMGALRSSSVDTPETPAWVEHYSSSSIKPPSEMQDTVDRGRFVTPVQIVNGYAQPHLLPPSPSPVMGFSRVHGLAAPTRQSPEHASLGQSVHQSKVLKASPYCVTNNINDTLDSSFIRPSNPANVKSANVYAVPGRFNEVQDSPNHGKEAIFLDAPQSADLRPESMNSDDLFLAAERACASSVGEITSLSSKSLSDPEAEGEQGSPPIETASAGLSASRVPKRGNGGSETTDSFHHNNPLYTDNEYESLAESHNNLLNIEVKNRGAIGLVGSEVPWTLPDCCPDLESDMQWLRDVQMSDAPTQSEQFDPAPPSVIASEVSASDGPVFPNYKRPSTPLGILHFTTGLSYDPPANFSAVPPTALLKHSPSQPSSNQQFQSYPFAPTSATTDSKTSRLPSATFKTSASLDLMSTRVIPSVGRQSDYDGMTTDFGDDEATQNSRSPSPPSRSEMDEEMTRPPSGMESSWMSEKDRSCEFSGSNIPPGQPDTVDCCGMEPCSNNQLTDSMLVETGGPIEDDLSEFSCAPSSISKAASCCLNGDCCDLPHNGHVNDSLNAHRGDCTVLSEASLPPSSAANADSGKRSCLPDIAPVGLPNFQCARVEGFSNTAHLAGMYDNLPRLPEVCRPLQNGELRSQRQPQSHASFSPAKVKLSGTYCSEYDNFENAPSGRGPERRVSQRQNQPAHRLGDYSSRSRHRNVPVVVRQRLDAALQNSVGTPPGHHQYQQRHHPSGWKPGHSVSRSRAYPPSRSIMAPFDEEIVNEARRICQRFQALGWRSVLSVDSEDQEAVSYSDSLAPSAGSSKPLFLLPDPQPVRHHPPVAAAVAGNLPTTDMNSEAFESDIGDNEETNASSYQQPHHGSRLLIPWSLASGHARSQSVDCLTSATFDVEEELLREADLEGDFTSSAGSPASSSGEASESVAPSSAVAGTSSSSSSSAEEEEEEDEESKIGTASLVIDSQQQRQSGRRRRCRRPHSSLLRRRAAQVRRLLPLELQPYVMPGCVSSVSPSTRHSSPPLSRRPSVCRSTVVGTTAGRPSGVGLRLLCIRTPHRSASDPQLGLRATNFSVSLR